MEEFNKVLADAAAELAPSAALRAIGFAYVPYGEIKRRALPFDVRDPAVFVTQQ